MYVTIMYKASYITFTASYFHKTITQNAKGNNNNNNSIASL